MSAIMMNEGKSLVLISFNQFGFVPNAPDLSVGIFTNNHNPNEADTLADYDEDAVAIGYSRVSLPAGTWNTGSTTDTVTFNSNNFSFPSDPYASTPILGYGYFIYDEANTTLMWAEKFDLPYTFPLIGGTLFLQLQLGCNQLPLP